MGIRASTTLSLQVGQDNSLDDIIFDRDISEMIDTLEHAVAHKLTLDALEDDVDVSFGDVAQARLIYIEADGEFEVVFGGSAATSAQRDGSGATYPTGFVGAETLLVTINTTPLTVLFTDPDETLQQVINRINSVAALSALAPVAFDTGTGQLRLKSPTMGDASIVNVTGGSALLVLGLSTGSTAGVNSQPGTSNLRIHRPADPSNADEASGVKSYFLATINTTSLRISNVQTDDPLSVRVLVAGDLVTPEC